MPEWNDHPGEASALQVYNTQSGFSQTTDLGGDCSSSGGTHMQYHCPASPPCETLLCMWVGPLLDVSSGSSLHVLQVRKDFEESQNVLLNAVSEIKAGQAVGPGWPRVLSQAGNLYCVSFIHVALCSSVLLWPSLLLSQFSWRDMVTTIRYPEKV